MQKDDDSIIPLEIKKAIRPSYTFQIKVYEYNLKEERQSYSVLKIILNDAYNELAGKKNHEKSIVSDVFLFFYILLIIFIYFILIINN